MLFTILKPDFCRVITVKVGYRIQHILLSLSVLLASE